MISRKEALSLIGESSKHGHMLLVGRVMAALASLHSCDRGRWELVGLLHDLDYEQTAGDRSKHGVVAADILRGRLHDEELYAIMCHDHRTGFEPFSKLDHSLIFADALAVLALEGGVEKPVTEEAVSAALGRVSGERPWIRQLVEGYPFGDMVYVPGLLNSVL
ncbi:HDIG domain-containing protein [Candidatus Bathyarchaeota archaeon]|nr:HDIG domain-containing protein [Candidatus Bathyarchaeota archaeon]